MPYSKKVITIVCRESIEVQTVNSVPAAIVFASADGDADREVTVRVQGWAAPPRGPAIFNA